MATRVPALIQLSDPRVAAQLVFLMNIVSFMLYLVSRISPSVSSHFQELPGEGALYCCLDAIVRTATSDKVPCDLAVRLVQSLSGQCSFLYLPSTVIITIMHL